MRKFFVFSCFIAISGNLLAMDPRPTTKSEEERVKESFDRFDEWINIGWRPVDTDKELKVVSPFKDEITDVLKLLNLDDDSKEILEIGSGYKGGIMLYLGDRKHITPSEIDEESYKELACVYPRAIKTSAQELAQNVDKKYDIVLLTNVMDMILTKGKGESLKALEAMNWS